MDHHFNTDIAKTLDVNQAIFLHNIAFWVKNNQANNVNFHDGYYWTFNSVKAHKEHFPYWSVQQLTRIINKLEDANIIKTKALNKAGYDRTKWYTIADKPICRIYKIHLSKSVNGIIEIDKPIPDSKPDSKHNNNISWFLKFLNETLKREFRIFDKIKLRQRLKTFSQKEIEQAILKASKSDFHKSTQFTHLTPEYFTRKDQIIDKWINCKSSEALDENKLTISEELERKNRS